MRDVDVLQEYEFKQQQLIEQIVNSLHQVTYDDEDYTDTFGFLVVKILHDLNEGVASSIAFLSSTDGDYKVFEEHVENPIEAFTESETERDYLLLKVLEKLIASISAGIIGEYHAEQLADEMKEHAS